MIVTERSRRLRKEATAPEPRLWQVLRNRALGAKARRQVPRGAYVLDIFFDEARLAVELDGETHATEAGQRHDMRRHAWLAGQGIRVLRVTNREVMGDLEGVLREPVQDRGAPLHPGADDCLWAVFLPPAKP